MKPIIALTLLALCKITLAGYVITSHKTAGLEYPENSLEGFIHSLDLDVDAIEFDVHYTKDREIVLTHDPVLDDYNCFKKGSNKKVIISQVNLEEIISITCFNEKLEKQYKIPTLDSVLEAYVNSGRNDIELNFEIKVWDELIQNWPRYATLDRRLFHIPENEMAELALKKVREFKIKSKILFTSFSRDLLMNLKKQQLDKEDFRYGLLFKGNYAPIRLGLLARILGYKCYEACWLPNWENTKNWLIKNEIDVFLPHFPQLTHSLYRKGFIKHFQKYKDPRFEIYPWTLNTEEEWLQSKEYQFDGMITDKPVKFLDWYTVNK
ncbi:MAG: glycerophosphodiester phosphodiesterase [Bacteriovoracaceae bacterium]|nr:glycerophosphodiester phosphodiesterase [Bacteriovoracaceae bacterium]